MNIFYTDACPFKAAEGQPDKMLVKMVLETAQMLSTAHRETGNTEFADEHALYKATHKNHPSSVWARTSVDNYIWLYCHFNALCDEYTSRYGKVHLTDTKLSEALATVPPALPDCGQTPMPQCMPEQFQHKNSVVAYRAYVQGTKWYATWMKKPESRPYWWTSVPSRDQADYELQAA